MTGRRRLAPSSAANFVQTDKKATQKRNSGELKLLRERYTASPSGHQELLRLDEFDALQYFLMARKWSRTVALTAAADAAFCGRKPRDQGWQPI